MQTTSTLVTRQLYPNLFRATDSIIKTFEVNPAEHPDEYQHPDERIANTLVKHYTAQQLALVDATIAAATPEKLEMFLNIPYAGWGRLTLGQSLLISMLDRLFGAA